MAGGPTAPFDLKATLSRALALHQAGRLAEAEPLYGQILDAVNSIDIPAGDQSAIDAALLSRVQTAIYLTMASPSFSAQF